MDKDELFYTLLKDQSSNIEVIKEDIKEIKEDLRVHIHRTEIAEENIEILKKANSDCPGRKMAEWNAGLMNRLKDWAIIVGLLITLLKLFKVIP